MTIKYTRTTLEKLVVVFEELGYRVRFEKGNFQSGSCIVMLKKMVVINKFYPIEEQIKSLISAIHTLDLKETSISDDNKEMYAQIQKHDLFNPMLIPN